MEHEASETEDRRVQRTRAAICAAFLRLIFARRYDSIRIAHLIAEADVGRSTFYAHFRNKDDVLVAVLDPILVPLADAAAGRGRAAQLQMMLNHVWQQRALGRVLFDPARMPRLQRRLAAMIGERLEGNSAEVPNALIAGAAAAAQLTALRMWLAGEAACPAAVLSDHLVGKSRARTA